MLLEHVIFAGALGEEIDPERLDRISVSTENAGDPYADCREYIISLTDCRGQEEHIRSLTDCRGQEKYIRRFRLTDALRKRWAAEHISFRIYIYLRDHKLAGGHIYKYKEIQPAGASAPAGYETEPTQQEIRIARRILDYIRVQEDHEAR